MKTYNYLIIVIILGLLSSSCNHEENYLEVNVRAIDLQVNMDENPEENQFIGKVRSSTNIGEVSYTILSQSPNNSFTINPSTGELYVNSPSLFDYEQNPVIKGVVQVINQDVFKNINLTVFINDVNEVKAYDFETTIYENPVENKILGFMQATANKGVLHFKMVSQEPENALAIDELTGQITVIDSLKFQFNLHHFVTGKVRVSSGEAYDDAEIKIIINKLEPGVCEGNVILRNNTELENFAAKNYHAIKGSLTITDDQTGDEIKSLEKLELLVLVGSGILIDGLEFLQNLEGFESLKSIGGLEIRNNKALLNVDALSNVEVCNGDILIRDNEVFEFYCGLQSIFINSPAFVNGSIEEKTVNRTSLLSSVPPRLKIFTTHNNLFNPKVEEVMALDCD